MPRTPARFTKADLTRAARVAVETGLRVRVEPRGDIVLEPVPEYAREKPPVDERPDYAF